MNGMDRQLTAAAERQFGVFARRQAAAAGLSEYAMTRRVRSGRWEELFPGVYRLPGTTRTGRQRAMAAVLWAGDHAAISHTTAARLLRLDSVRSRELHVTVLPTAGLRRNDLTLHHSATLPRYDTVTVDGIRCTSATRTIIDCAALLDDEVLEAAFEARAADGADERDRVGAARRGAVRARAAGLGRHSTSARGAAASRTSDGVPTRGEARALAAQELAPCGRAPVSGRSVPARFRVAGGADRL